MEAERGKIRGYLYLEVSFGFCKTFKKITENLGLHSTFKIADLQNVINTTKGVPICITINNLYLYVSIFIPNAETQAMFNESVENSFTLSFDLWCTYRELVGDGLEFRIEIVSAQNINSPNCLLTAHQTLDRTGDPNKAKN